MKSKAKYPLRFVARATVEFETPFIIGSGGEDLFFDDVFVADANGLPTLPGSSLAGILRHAWFESGRGEGNELFGWQDGDKGHGSRLSVSWGCIHDSLNRPVEGIVYDRKRLDDPVLAEARTLAWRDHVRIDHKGTAANGGKFDERTVSAGHRFTFELLLEGSKEDKSGWQDLLALLLSDSIRIGGKTRRGYGQFKVIELREGVFNLSLPEEFAAFGSHPISLAKACTLPDILQTDRKPIPKSGDSICATLHLKPESFWMIGGGFDKDVDMAPLKANRVVWSNGKAEVQPDQVIVPGSSLKGAIAHRVAYHYNRLSGIFAGDGVNPEDHSGENNPAVRTLFGFCKDSKTGKNEGQRGRVIISDLFVDRPGEQKMLNHVSIDRFTGGARVLEGALFDEKPYYGGPGFVLNVVVDQPEKIEDVKIRKALDATLADLAQGRLAIGAGAGRGNGYFRAEDGVKWDKKGAAWIAGGAQ